MNTRLLFMGVDNSVMEALEYAKSKGIYTIVTDYNPPEKVKEKQIADDYWMINVADLDALEQKCREEGVTNIYAGNHEFCLDQCKKLCERLGFPFYASDEGWRAARDNAFYKQVCQECGLDTPKRYHLDENFTQEDLDTLPESRRYFFVYLNKDRWGFNIVPVYREGAKLFKGKEEFCSFEMDILQESFFDGRK